MSTLHLISHTHWDREWYQPFQVFRIQLVHLIDNLLAIMKNDRDYAHFMLDGQTIVLEDYLQIRPENEKYLKELIRQGRILIGPWYILPDEFLVSPEATIRNLLRGKKLCEEFGKRMMIGYIPDPFGHIAQMPQILQGFNIDTSCLRRGLSDEPCELLWQAPDGSRVFLSYLKNGYDNATHLPADKKDFLSELTSNVTAIRDSSRSTHLLLMNGTDHQEPIPETPACIEYANQRMDEDHIILSTLPDYFYQLKTEIEQLHLRIPLVKGELRDCKRHHLLPGVLSSRIWIKQLNHRCENYMERWVEPFNAWAELLSDPSKHQNRNSSQIMDTKPFIQLAWTELMKCHPHDSICGCSVDEVHEEMRARFLQVDQIANEITSQSLDYLSSIINTTHSNDDPGYLSLVVFNSSPFPQIGYLTTEIPIPFGISSFALIDENCKPIPSTCKYLDSRILFERVYDRAGLFSAINSIHDNQISGKFIHDIYFDEKKDDSIIEIALDDKPTPQPEMIKGKIATILKSLKVSKSARFTVAARTPRMQIIEFISTDVPAIGYKTYWLKPDASNIQTDALTSRRGIIQNEFYKIILNKDTGDIDIIDKLTNVHYEDVLRFEDGGDRGDEYNYNPPDHDVLIEPVISDFSESRTDLLNILKINYDLFLPESLSDDRNYRSSILTHCPLTTTITLLNGISRIDIEIMFANKVNDHRIRFQLHTGIPSKVVLTDGHFEIIERKIEKINFQPDWIEQPRPEVPQRLFANVNTTGKGIMLVNDGLPEIGFQNDQNDKAVISLTLLRSVGWLSRDDLSLRNGAAGPLLSTPGAQEIGEHVFHLAVIPHSGNWEAQLPSAYGSDNPMKAVISSIHPGRLESSMSFIGCDNSNFLITAIKKSENGEGIILRGYNITNEKIHVKFVPVIKFKQVLLVQLDETPITPIDLNSRGDFEIEVGAKKIITMKLKN